MNRYRRGHEPGGLADADSARAAGLVARLELACAAKDAAAAARLIDRLAATEDGRWLVRQFVAAGFRLMADDIVRGGGDVIR